MAYYNVCPDCGCSLDPGERCDCKDRAEETLKRPVLRMEVEQNTGQLRMILGRKYETVTIA